MAFPTTTPTKANLDQGTDSASAARSELATLVDLVTQIIQSYAQIDGICDLDDAGKVPAARIPAGASSGIDADLLDGEEGTAYHNASNLNAGTVPGARFADSSHGNRSGGSLHATATQSVAGFMSAADKQAVDSIDADIAASRNIFRRGPGALAYLASRSYNPFPAQNTWLTQTTPIVMGGTVTAEINVLGVGQFSPANISWQVLVNNTVVYSGSRNSAGVTRYNISVGDNSQVAIKIKTDGNRDECQATVAVTVGSGIGRFPAERFS